MAGISPIVRPVSSVPGVGMVSAAAYGYIKRVPGADVALGVMAYELASSAQMAVASANRGRSLHQEVQTRVGRALEETVGRMGNVGEHGLELARHATRGAVLAGGELGERAEQLARSAATGAIRTLERLPVNPLDSLRGVGYGIVQGALEAHDDPAKAATAALKPPGRWPRNWESRSRKRLRPPPPVRSALRPPPETKPWQQCATPCPRRWPPRTSILRKSRVIPARNRTFD